MDIENLKYVVGKVDEGQPAVIRFFDSVNEYSCKQFNDEFLWLQDYVKPSKIIVLINSEGGSILYGMSTFSIINCCPIEVDCVIEGIAASMASVIWAAGDNLYMHDYSILMIHNPFHYDKETEDENIKAMINAFRGQLATIYQKRFGLTKDEVDAIMDGDEGKDGTYFDAKAAVKAGFISKENVIKTAKQVKDKVKNSIDGITDSASLREAFASVCDELDANKLVEAVSAIRNADEHTNQIQKISAMEKELLSVVAAQLGFNAEVEAPKLSSRISELLNAEASLKDAQAKLAEFDTIKAELEELKIKYAGKEAEAQNAASELESVKASLKAYRDAEAQAKEAEIEATINAAVEAGKIDASAKEQWTEMARSNFDMVKATLDSIKGRDVISEEIKNDPENARSAQKTLEEAEAAMAEKVKAVVGDYKFRTF